MRFYWPIAKIDHEQRMVWGYASTEAEDEQGEIVKRAALAAALGDYLRFANIREMHQPSAVGIAKEASVDDKGLYLGAKIVDDEAWQKVREGVYKGFSIGGRVTARDDGDRKVITGLALTEISLVDRPANPEAVFDCWKAAAADAVAAPVADYADPGYQEDGEKRYPLDSERHIRAAWAFIHQPGNARRYTAGQLARLKARIADAWRARIDPQGPPVAAGEPAPSDTLREAAQAPDGAALPPLLQRLPALLAELCRLIEPMVAAQHAVAAMTSANTLRKAGPPPEPSDALAKFAGEILPRLDALQQRVEDIARTPLPPVTAARGIAAIAKREDGAAPVAADDLVAALARMSDEERTLLLIKAAYANPIAATRRGFAHP